MTKPTPAGWSNPVDASYDIPSGKLTVCYGKSPFLMGKSTISMTIFNSYVKLPEGTSFDWIKGTADPAGNRSSRAHETIFLASLAMSPMYWRYLPYIFGLYEC